MTIQDAREKLFWHFFSGDTGSAFSNYVMEDSTKYCIKRGIILSAVLLDKLSREGRYDNEILKLL